MATFNGTLTIEGDDSGAIPVEAVVAEGSLTLRSKGASLGRWPVETISAEPGPAGVGLVLDEDRVFFKLGEASDFLSAVRESASVRAPAKRSRRRSTKASSSKRRRFGFAAYLALAVVVALVVASALAPVLVGSGAMLVGLIVLLVGASAMLESSVALRLPGGLEGIHLIVVGVVVVMIGIALTLAG